MASPRPCGNTAELLKPFVAELQQNDSEVEYITLADKNIFPCLGCYACQQIDGEYGCIQHDDTDKIMASIIDCDCVVFATPIYTWYCTPPMKALLDRTYGLNKYYGSAAGSLWGNKDVAIIATHGYEGEAAFGPFETGIKHLCEHSHLNYRGLYSVRDEDNLASFLTKEAVTGAVDFAKKLIG